MEFTVKNVPLTQLQIHPKNIRKNYGNIDELADSIKEHGIMQNLTIVPSGQAGMYNVLCGNRRLLAAQKIGLTEVPCVIKNLSLNEQFIVMATENMQRENLTPYEEGMAFVQLTWAGLSVGDIAKKTGLSIPTVRSRMEIAKLDQAAADARFHVFEDETGVYNELTLTDFANLSKIDDIDERNRILREAKNSGELNLEVKRFLDRVKKRTNYEKFKDAVTDLDIKETDESPFMAGKKIVEKFDMSEIPDMDAVSEVTKGIPNVQLVQYDDSAYLVTQDRKPVKTPEMVMESMTKARFRELKAVFEGIYEDIREYVFDILNGTISSDSPDCENNLVQAYVSKWTTLDRSAMDVYLDGADTESDEKTEEFYKTDMSLQKLMLLILLGRLPKGGHCINKTYPFYNTDACEQYQTFVNVLSVYGYRLPEGKDTLLTGENDLYKEVKLSEE